MMRLARFLSLGCLTLFVLVQMTGCKRKEAKTIPISHQYASDTIQAVLQPDKDKVTSGEPIVLLFAILNGTDTPICFDGRMAYPGNLDVLVKLPDSRVVRVITMAVDLVQASKKDMMYLPPGRLYGRLITVMPQSTITVKELKAPVPGVYTFWVEYHSRAFAAPDCKPITLKSNHVDVVIYGRR